jgi:hypothetical protein
VNNYNYLKNTDNGRVHYNALSTKIISVAFIVIGIWLFLATAPAIALQITVSGSIPDLDLDGSNEDEVALLDAVLEIWSHHIRTDRSFQLNVEDHDFQNGPYASGRLDTFNSEGIPASGTLFIDSNLFNNFNSTTLSFFWFVDDTPFDSSEFTIDTDYDDNHRHYINGPRSEYADERHIDALTILLHEVGHALGWSAHENEPGFNSRYVALMVPQPEFFAADVLVHLISGEYDAPLAGDGVQTTPYDSVGNELSHMASQNQIPGWKGTLMSAVFYFADRYHPGVPDIQMFQHAYDDVVTTVPYIPGDLAPRGNPDGMVNVADTLILVRILLGNITSTPTEELKGDLNMNGGLDTGDLALLSGMVLSHAP